VPEDASLDAFDSENAESADTTSETQRSDDEESAATDEPATADEPTTADETVDAEESADDALLVADPAVSTFDWSPEGGECAGCGESVQRRWRADGERGGELVCADCKEW
jgi:hypothetical protein